MTKNVKVGVVGCGYWGPNLVRNFRDLPDSELICICDKDSDRISSVQARFPGVEAYDDIDVMLDQADLDAVTICTPVHLHFPLAKKALEAGKHTLIEKPMAASAAECEELIALAHKNGVVLMVGHTFLYSPPVRQIKSIIDSGDIGTVEYISSRRLNLGLFQKDINVAWDLAPHDVSIVLYLIGKMPASVNCQGNANVTPGIEDVTNMSLQFPGGEFAMVQSSWLDPRKVREMTIVGSQRMIVYDDVEPLQKIRVYDTRVDATPAHYDTFAEFQYSYHYGDMHAPRIEQQEPLKQECQHFIDCICNGETPLSSGDNGLGVVKVMEAASASLKNGGSRIPLTANGT